MTLTANKAPVLCRGHEAFAILRSSYGAAVCVASFHGQTRSFSIVSPNSRTSQFLASLRPPLSK